MTDGLVIMAIGMGTVFAFLVILMIFMRLLGLRQGPAPAPRTAASKPAPAGAVAGTPAPEADEAVARAAAIAVAIELAGRRSAAGLDASAAADPGAAWRASGRASLHQGPQVVSSVLASRRSGK